MPTNPDIVIDLRHLEALEAGINSLATHASPVFDRMLSAWARIYKGFAQRRFALYSRGGGNWPPLKTATLARSKVRQRKKSKSTSKRGVAVALSGHGTMVPTSRRYAILRETGTLFNALHPRISKPGSLEKTIPFGVQVGFGGTDVHPEGKGKKISEIASYHQEGSGSLPQRRIIVMPNDVTLRAMRRAAEAALMEAHNAG